MWQRFWFSLPSKDSKGLVNISLINQFKYFFSVYLHDFYYCIRPFSLVTFITNKNITLYWCRAVQLRILKCFRKADELNLTTGPGWIIRFSFSCTTADRVTFWPKGELQWLPVATDSFSRAGWEMRIPFSQKSSHFEICFHSALEQWYLSKWFFMWKNMRQTPPPQNSQGNSQWLSCLNETDPP